MDRFIDGVLSNVSTVIGNLKSNMDRFIGQEPAKLYQQVHYLKSNMDRFIVRWITNFLNCMMI